MWNSFFLLCVVLLVEGAAVDVSVLEGDSVTLEADNIALKTDDWIRWKFNGIFICKMKKTGEDFIIKNDFDLDKKFIGRLEPNIKTGSLKITNIRTEHAGLYKVEMKSTTDTSKNYIVTVNGREQTASVMEGYSVILRTGLIKIQGYDQIKWEFGDQIIAVINQKNNQLLFPNGDDKGRLQLTENSGSLNISRTKSTDSGVYHLQMNSRSHTLQRNITVTVSVSSGAVSRIYSASFGLVVWAVTLSLLQV